MHDGCSSVGWHAGGAAVLALTAAARLQPEVALRYYRRLLQMGALLLLLFCVYERDCVAGGDEVWRCVTRFRRRGLERYVVC